MIWIIKMVWIVASMVSGQITVPEVPVVEPIVQVENEITETQVWVATPEEEVYPDFRVVDMADSNGMVAHVPDLPATVSPDDNWAMFWVLNPEIEAMVEGNR